MGNKNKRWVVFEKKKIAHGSFCEKVGLVWGAKSSCENKKIYI